MWADETMAHRSLMDGAMDVWRDNGESERSISNRPTEVSARVMTRHFRRVRTPLLLKFMMSTEFINALGPAPYPHVTVNIDNPQGRIQDLMLGGGTKFGKGSGDRLRSPAGPPRSSWVLSI